VSFSVLADSASDFEQGWMQLKKKGSDKCLDVHAPAQWSNGARVQIWECNGQLQQQWKFSEGSIVTRAGKCLDVHAPDQLKNGARIQVWDCNGSMQQRWHMRGNEGDPKLPFKIISGAGKCLTVKGKEAYPHYRNGDLVTVWDCNDLTKRDEQKWRVLPRLIFEHERQE